MDKGYRSVCINVNPTHVYSKLTFRHKNLTMESNVLKLILETFEICRRFIVLKFLILSTSQLEHHGFRGIPLQRFKDCLSNRLQYVQLNDCKTDKMTINRGVPQGSVLGPLIFLLYVNDIQNASTKLTFVLFADDTNVFFFK